MATIIYTKSTSTDLDGGTNDLLEASVRLLIEHENEISGAKKGICDLLFNVEDSQRYSETLVNHTEFGAFGAVAEGDAAEGLSAKENGRKSVEHIQFMGEFGISANMIEDAGYGIAADSRRLIRNFVRSYYRTRNKLAEASLINGALSSMTFNTAAVDLTTADGKPLFSSTHSYGDSGTQSNTFYSARNANESISAALIEEYLGELTVKLRNMKDENGDVLGFNADMILLPGNNPALESAVRKAVYSVNATGGSLNDANLEYGKWNIVVLPHWTTEDDTIYIMSSEANKTLGGNMFFNRVPLTVKAWEDYHTGNRMWNGRCRFGVGFGSYKHILKFTSCPSAETVSGATAL